MESRRPGKVPAGQKTGRSRRGFSGDGVVCALAPPRAPIADEITECQVCTSGITEDMICMSSAH
ncbi:MAG: hypothetical protein BJ554DRAFT_85 [Olpidium bornovanus]|uniref:Uncharacterized protein n=1 Tax=Olpidium bornovanus TaxID=278681 RepID=A0A8H8DIW8_9FUNG|nr:MAG: hypothetical protein BJ554DRAFT_85 [Olpidium bornovanus]